MDDPAETVKEWLESFTLPHDYSIIIRFDLYTTFLGKL